MKLSSLHKKPSCADNGLHAAEVTRSPCAIRLPNLSLYTLNRLGWLGPAIRFSSALPCNSGDSGPAGPTHHRPAYPDAARCPPWHEGCTCPATRTRSCHSRSTRLAQPVFPPSPPPRPYGGHFRRSASKVTSQSLSNSTSRTSPSPPRKPSSHRNPAYTQQRQHSQRIRKLQQPDIGVFSEFVMCVCTPESPSIPGRAPMPPAVVS